MTRIPAFYDPPSPLPAGEPGALIRAEPLTDAPTGVRGWRVLYHSRANDDADSAVSGLVLAPDREPPAEGFPLLAVAHGTTGIARSCAPSLEPGTVSPEGISTYGLLEPYVQAGYVVAASDYQGLGGPGAPAYLLGLVEGRNVLDAARAARGIDGLPVHGRIFIQGHSQGGHGACFAAQLAASYAPELPLLGAVLCAPAAELELMALGISLIRHPLPAVAFIVMAVYAWSLVYPDARLEDVLTPAGMQALDGLQQTCGMAMYGPFEEHPPHHYFKPAGIVAHRAWREAIAANVPGRASIGAPVFIAQGEADQIVPPLTTQLFAHRLIAAGTQVSLNMYPGADHMGVLPVCRADILAWMSTRAQSPDA